jgi:glycosyltransferase involved in cell wall biosynthesis
MKILFIKSGIHHKNLHFILNCKKIQIHLINNVNEINNYNLSDYDAVYSPCDPIDISKYPNTKFIFGPHFSVFPEINQMKMIKGNNVIYIQPSEWAANVWINNPLCDNIKIKQMSFGVDTEKFKNIKPINERNKVFIYYKNRSPHDLNIIQQFLTQRSIQYRVFSYYSRYDENDYIQYLQESKFGFWIGGHESQGFGLEEALSCDVPLVVWNVKSMNQEYMSTYHDIPATSIPYWDQRCGEYFYNIEELEEIFNLFLLKLETYKPREHIVEKLSMEVCEDKMIELIKNI